MTLIFSSDFVSGVAKGGGVGWLDFYPSFEKIGPNKKLYKIAFFHPSYQNSGSATGLCHCFSKQFPSI